MELRSVLALPLRSYLTMRSLGFLAEFQTLSKVVKALPGTSVNMPERDKETLEFLLEDVQKLFQEDAENIVGGIYPIEVLKPESITGHFKRLPKLLVDGVKASRRKKNKKSKSFGKESQALLEEMPDYYKRNFHFQTDGYLSKDSAELYEHQVEMLFLGSADSMRRMIIQPIKNRLNTKDGDGIKILEIACGTGKSTQFLKQAFPKARITATDISAPYLKIAQKKLKNFNRIDFLETAAENLPFKDESFDIVCSTFLFHELPQGVRREVLREAARVLRPSGWTMHLDSIQKGDQEEYNEALKRFPIDFHEPFYKNYTEDPLDKVLEECGFNVFDQKRGFLSKVIAGQKV